MLFSVNTYAYNKNSADNQGKHNKAFRKVIVTKVSDAFFVR